MPDGASLSNFSYQLNSRQAPSQSSYFDPSLMNNSKHFQVKQEERPAVHGRFNMFGKFDQNLNFDSAYSIRRPLDSSSSGIISSNESVLTKMSVNEEDNGYGLSLSKYSKNNSNENRNDQSGSSQVIPTESAYSE